jgi:hypothetical protein
MGRLHSSWHGRAVLATAAVALLVAENVADAGPLRARLAGVFVPTGAPALRKRRSA